MVRGFRCSIDTDPFLICAQVLSDRENQTSASVEIAMSFRTKHHARRRQLAILSPLAVLFPAAAWAQVSTYQTIRVVDPIVHNTDSTLNATDSQPDSENSIAINPQNPNELVMTGFAESFTSFSNGAIFHSLDSGATWSGTVDRSDGGFGWCRAIRATAAGSPATAARRRARTCRRRCSRFGCSGRSIHV